MSGALSKRQQARNEKVLQELVQNVPGNNICADCHARNPSWASWSLGIFLCMRCAAIHRKLGVHVSKVKSLSMDSWSNEQVENMKKVGNLVSNKLYNPQAKKAPVPVDVDEVDSAMERFIRQKYTDTAVTSGRRHNTGSTESDETPPPLPPKTPSRFGFRSATSLFPLSSKSRRESGGRGSPSPRDTHFHSPESPHRNKPSKVFGASVLVDSPDDTDRKLAKLRDMGFTDDQRNAIVLKGVNGNLERTVETLVRLGGGGARSPSSLVAPRESSLYATNRSITPATTSSGLSVPQSARPATASSNPFDNLDMPPAQPQSSQSTGTLQTKNPYLNNNPFGVPSPSQQDAIAQAFQNLSVAPSQQPLFPNHTGGVPNMQQSQQVLYQHQVSTPPMLATQQNYTTSMFNGNQTYPQPSMPVASPYNPFLSPQQPSLSVNTAAYGGYGNNPFTKSPTRIQSPTLGQIPEQVQQNFYSPAAQQQTWAMSPQPQVYSPNHQANNPFFSQPAPMPQAMMQPQRPDTASIMALYNVPQAASPQPLSSPNIPTEQRTAQASNQEMTNSIFGQSMPQQQQQQQQQSQPVQPLAPLHQQQSAFPQQTVNGLRAEQPRTIASPITSTNNPFLSSAAQPVGPALLQTGNKPIDIMTGNRSRDSMMALGMEWSNGRHSPDAFASLSARH